MMQIDFFIYLMYELHQFTPSKITLCHYSTLKLVIFQYCILVCFCVVRMFAYMLKNLSTSHETMSTVVGHILVLCHKLVQTGFLATT